MCVIQITITDSFCLPPPPQSLSLISRHGFRQASNGSFLPPHPNARSPLTPSPPPHSATSLHIETADRDDHSISQPRLSDRRPLRKRNVHISAGFSSAASQGQSELSAVPRRLPRRGSGPRERSGEREHHRGDGVSDEHTLDEGLRRRDRDSAPLGQEAIGEAWRFDVSQEIRLATCKHHY